MIKKNRETTDDAIIIRHVVVMVVGCASGEGEEDRGLARHYLFIYHFYEMGFDQT